MGSLEHSLSCLSLDGSLRADGESFGEGFANQNIRTISNMGPGGGSGGTILLFVQTVALSDSSVISTVGGHGSPNGGGGGGGGRVHFHWSEIPVGDAYVPIANVKGSILTGFVFDKKAITICLTLFHCRIFKSIFYLFEFSMETFEVANYSSVH